MTDLALFPRECLLAGVLAASALTTSARAQERQQFGAATFVPPSGFTVDRKPTLLQYHRIRDRDLCLIVVYGAESSSPALDAAFTTAWTTVFQQGYRRADRPPSSEERSPGGYRHAFGEGPLEDLRGNRFVARMRVFPLPDRKTQTIVWMGNGIPALDGCRPEWDAFYASLTFPGVVAEADRRPGSTDPPASVPSSVSVSPRPGATEPGGPQSYENITFQPPSGWRVDRSAAGVTLTPTVTRPGEVLQVLLLPGRVSNRDLPAEFGPAWQELVRGFGATPMNEVSGGNYSLEEPARSLRGYQYLHGTGGMRRGNETYTLQLYLFRAGDRVERVAVVARQFRVNLLTLNAAMSPVHEPAIRRLVFSLRFANQPPREPPPARLAGADSVSGVWAGITMSFGSLKPTFAVLFTDGTAFFGANLPTGGFDGIEPAIEEPTNRRSWGRFSMTGGTGEIVMPYGKVPIRLLGAGLEVTTSGTAHKFVRLSMPASGELPGTWCLDESRCLELLPGKRFRDQGAVRVMEHASYDYPESPERGEGRYALRDHTLTLEYDGGPTIRIVFPGLDGGPGSSPRTILAGFNLDALKRR